MVSIVRTEWSGTSGGPGLTQLACWNAASPDWNPAGTQGAVDAVRAFWNAIKVYLPNELSLVVSPVIDEYDTETAELIASFTAGSAPAVVLGSSAAVYAAGAGAKITWNTGQIRNGRRVRGQTFLVPIANTAYTASGTIDSGVATSINTAAATMLTALATAGTSLAVWSRPIELPEPRAGAATEVLTGTLSAKTAILRGRRD